MSSQKQFLIDTYIKSIDFNFKISDITTVQLLICKSLSNKEYVFSPLERGNEKGCVNKQGEMKRGVSINKGK